MTQMYVNRYFNWGLQNVNIVSDMKTKYRF